MVFGVVLQMHGSMVICLRDRCLQHSEHPGFPADSLAYLCMFQVRSDAHESQVVVPTLTPAATLLALHHVLSNLQTTIRTRQPSDLSRPLLISLGEWRSCMPWLY